MSNRVISPAVASAVALPLAITFTPAWAASTASCDVFAYTPFAGGDEVGGTGGRSGCISTVSVKTRLKYDRFGPDPTTAFRGGRVTNITWTAYGCSGRQSYYTNTSTDSGQVSGSLNRTITC
jgi:hypothetical protein